MKIDNPFRRLPRFTHMFFPIHIVNCTTTDNSRADNISQKTAVALHCICVDSHYQRAFFSIHKIRFDQLQFTKNKKLLGSDVRHRRLDLNIDLDGELTARAKYLKKSFSDSFAGQKLADIDALLRQVRKQAWNTPKSHRSYTFWR